MTQGSSAALSWRCSGAHYDGAIWFASPENCIRRCSGQALRCRRLCRGMDIAEVRVASAAQSSLRCWQQYRAGGVGRVRAPKPGPAHLPYLA